MAKQRSQSKGKGHSQTKRNRRNQYLAQLRGEMHQLAMTAPISDYEADDLFEEDIMDEAALPDENDDEIILDRVEEDFNPNEFYDPFEFNPVANTSQISQRNNMVFLKNEGNRLKLCLNGHMRRAIVSYQRQFERDISEYKLESMMLYHSYMKPVFVVRLVNFLQESLDGYFPFELDDFDFLSCLPLSTSKDIETATGINRDTIRKYLKNLSLQLEDGLLVSFNLITPEGQLPGKLLLRFRRTIGQGENKQKFIEMVQKGQKFRVRDFLRSQLLEEWMEKRGFNNEELEQLSENQRFKKIVEKLREKPLL